MDKSERELRLAVKKYVIFVQSFLDAMDHIMKTESNYDRGKSIGGAVESLDLQNQSVMHFNLGMTWGQIDKIRNKKDNNKLRDSTPLKSSHRKASHK
jgi:hypothetical protein